MEKEYLGLGVVFNALDKGFKKSVEGIKDALSGVNNAMVQATKSAGGGMFDKIGEGLKMLSLSKIGSTLSDVKDGIQGTGHGVNELAKDLDFTRAKMTAALDPKTASQFTGQLMGAMNAAGLTAHELDTVANNLLNSGVAADHLGDTLPMIGTLVGKLNMDAGQVSTMFGQMQGYLHMSGKQATGLTKEIFRLQKNYNLTNLMESLPGITENVYENMLKLGKASPKMAMSLIRDVTGMAAAFQKMGMSQQKAASTATTFNDKMTEVQNAFKDLQAGLAPNSDIIQDIYSAFGAGGLDATGLINAIKSGKKTNSEIMQQMQGMVAGLGENDKNAVMQRLRRTLGDDVSNVLGPMAKTMGDVNKQAAKQAKSVGSAEEAFGAFDAQLTGTLSNAEKVNTAVKALQGAVTTLANKSGLMEYFNASTEATRNFTDEISKGESILARIAKLVDGFKVGGLSYFFKGLTKFQPVVDILSEMVFSLTALWGIIKIGAGPLKWFGSFFGTLLSPLLSVGSAFGEIGSVVGMFFGGIAEGAPIIGELGAAIGLLANPVGIIVAAVAALGAVVYAVASHWDDLAGVVDYFSKDAGDAMRSFGKKVGKVWGGIMDAAASAWDFIKGGVSWLTTTLVNYFKFTFAFWKTGWDIATHVVAGVVNMLSGFWTRHRDEVLGVWNSIVDGIQIFFKTISGIAGSYIDDISGLIGKIAGAISRTLKPVFEPLMKWFGGIASTVGDSLASIWDPMVRKFKSVKDFITNGIASMFDALPGWLKDDLGQMASAFKKVLFHDNSPAQGMAAAATAVAAAPTVSAQGGTSVAMPTKAQPGAPSNSNISGMDLTPTAVPKVDDKNTQAMLQMMAETKDAIVRAIAQGGNVTVVLQGDAKKFLQVINQDARNRAGAAGQNSALGG